MIGRTINMFAQNCEIEIWILFSILQMAFFSFYDTWSQKNMQRNFFSS